MSNAEKPQRRGGDNISITGYARVTAIITSVVMAIAMVSTVLMILPADTPFREPVRSVAAPYFAQSWKVFAPNILKVNRTLELSAQWRGADGELVTSGWVSITDIEAQTIHGNMAPSRVEKNSWNASETYMSRYNALTPDQKTRVRDTFIEVVDGEFRPMLSEDLIEELAGNEGDVVRFLRMDYMFMRYTTLYATAGFGKNIERVQWRVILERPNDFQHRFRDEKQFEDTVVTFGWRQSAVRTDPEVVDEYRGLIERTGMGDLFRKAAENVE